MTMFVGTRRGRLYPRLPHLYVLTHITHAAPQVEAQQGDTALMQAIRRRAGAEEVSQLLANGEKRTVNSANGMGPIAPLTGFAYRF